MTTFLNMEVSELPSTHKLCYLGDCNFTRASVAYDYKGDEVAVNQPRFTHRVPDTTVTNLLSDNQSDGGDTLNPELLTLNQRTGTEASSDTTGFVAKTGATISSTTEDFHTGTRSLKVVTPGSVALEGAYTDDITTVAGTTYTTGAWVKAPAGAKMNLRLIQSNFAILAMVNFTATGNWEWQEVSAAAVTTKSKLVIDTVTDAQAITFYVDDLRLATNDTTGFSSQSSGVMSVTGEKSYQGYRSLKVVTPGSVVREGTYITQTGLTVGQTYTLSGRIFAPAGSTIKIEYMTPHLTLTGTGAWQSFSLTGIATGKTHYLVFATVTSAQAITFNLDSLMFQTGSIASNWAYGGSSYSTYKTEQGCLVEEAHTNLLTANQSTCTDTSGDTTGLESYGTGTTISSSTEQYIQGSKSLKVVTTGESETEGFYISCTGLTPGIVYTTTGKFHASEGTILRALHYNADYYTGNNEWQDFRVSFTATGTSRTFYFTTYTQQAITFYVDMLQLTATAYPLSWTLGGTTQAAETLTAPSSAINIPEGTVELEVFLNSAVKNTALARRVFCHHDTATWTNNRIEILLDSSTSKWNLNTSNTSQTAVLFTNAETGSNIFRKLSANYNSGSSNIYSEGTPATPSSSPKLPANAGIINIGDVGVLAPRPSNTIIRNVVISKIKRTDEDVTARAESDLPVADEYCTMIYPLTKDLSAYRVVER